MRGAQIDRKSGEKTDDILSRRLPVIGRVVFVVTGLDCGGAEMMMLRMLTRVDRSRVFPSVVSLRGEGVVRPALRDLDIPLHELNLRSIVNLPCAMNTLFRNVRKLRPALLQGWMLHGNLMAHLVNLGSWGRIPVVWNMRHSLHDLGNERLATRAIIPVLRLLSFSSARIVYNSHVVARQHERIGFKPERTVVIPNGFDCDRIRPGIEHRAALRAHFSISGMTPLIGLVARVHASKDHGTFLEAARRLVLRGSDAHFVLVGRGTDEPEMLARIAALSLSDRVHALGERADVGKVVPAFDIATSSSRAEAFPNAVGEAMACGVPCVVTDVGDSAWLVGDTGRSVPRADPDALCDAWWDLLSLGPSARESLGRAARNRVKRYFSLDSVVAQYEKLYTDVLHDWHSRSRYGLGFDDNCRRVDQSRLTETESNR